MCIYFRWHKFCLISCGFIFTDGKILIILRKPIFAVVRYVMFMSYDNSRKKNNFLLNYRRCTNWINIIRPYSQFKVLENIVRSSPSEVFLGKSVLRICSKFTGEHPCRSAISVKLQTNFIEIALGHGCSPVNLLHILGTPFPKNTSEGLFLQSHSLRLKPC